MRIVDLPKALALTVTLAGVLAAAQHIVDWPARVQQPYEHLPSKDLGLAPLLVDESGMALATPAAWEKKKAALTTAWRDRLGNPPEPARALAVQLEKEENLPDHTRRLLTIAIEGMTGCGLTCSPPSI